MSRLSLSFGCLQFGYGVHWDAQLASSLEEHERSFEHVQAKKAGAQLYVLQGHGAACPPPL